MPTRRQFITTALALSAANAWSQKPQRGKSTDRPDYAKSGAVIVPVSGEKSEDDKPLGILREVFAGRKVIGVSGRVLAKGGGGVHCITQQIPA